MLLFFLSVFLFLVSSKTTICIAADYYVAPAGDNSNIGTLDAPFKNIQVAVNIAVGGDVVHVAPGIYPERITSSRSGSAFARIRFVSDTRWGAKISPIDAGGASWWGSFGWDNSANFVDIVGFEITPGKGAGMTAGIISHSADNVQIISNKIHHINKAYMTGDGPGGIAVEGTNVNLIGNFIYDVGEPGNNKTHGIYFASGIGNAINNVIGYISGFAIHTWHNVKKLNCIHNTLFNLGQGAITIGDGDSSVDTIAVSNSTIAYNIAYVTSGQGIREWGQVGNNLFLHNLVFNGGLPYETPRENVVLSCLKGDMLFCRYLYVLIRFKWKAMFEASEGRLSLIKGIESGTIIDDPQFVNYKADGTGDYHLKPTSPAIDQRSALALSPSVDIDGVNRPQGSGNDIGAYELIYTVE